MARRKPRKSAYIPPQHEVTNRRPKARVTRASGTSKGSRFETRVPQPPSWRRIGKQAPIYYVVVAVAQYLLAPHHDRAGHAISQGERLLTSAGSSLAVIVAFIPFMYFLERNRWRRYQQTQNRSGDERQNRMVAR